MQHENDQHDMFDDFFIFEKFESIDEFMQFSSLKNEYDNNANFFENFNVFIKRQEYAVNITETKRNKTKLKNKMYIDCTREKKFANTNIDKRNVVFERIDCFFKIVDVLKMYNQ